MNGCDEWCDDQSMMNEINEWWINNNKWINDDDE